MLHSQQKATVIKIVGRTSNHTRCMTLTKMTLHMIDVHARLLAHDCFLQHHAETKGCTKGSSKASNNKSNRLTYHHVPRAVTQKVRIAELLKPGGAVAVACIRDPIPLRSWCWCALVAADYFLGH